MNIVLKFQDKFLTMSSRTEALPNVYSRTVCSSMSIWAVQQLGWFIENSLPVTISHVDKGPPALVYARAFYAKLYK
jgi:hypothetical protein